MKLKLTLIFVLLTSITAYAQTPNNIAVEYGFSSTDINIHGAAGDFGYRSKSGMNFGLIYTRKISPLFSVQSGLLFADDQTQRSTITDGTETLSSVQHIKLFSVPAFAKFTFLKYLFADAGLSLDKQTNVSNENIVNSQSGIGIEGGAGAQYTFSNFCIFINAYIKRYGLVHLHHAENYTLSENGLKFGIGYNF